MFYFEIIRPTITRAPQNWSPLIGVTTIRVGSISEQSVEYCNNQFMR